MGKLCNGVKPLIRSPDTRIGIIKACILRIIFIRIEISVRTFLILARIGMPGFGEMPCGGLGIGKFLKFYMYAIHFQTLFLKVLLENVKIAFQYALYASGFG